MFCNPRGKLKKRPRRLGRAALFALALFLAVWLCPLCAHAATGTAPGADTLTEDHYALPGFSSPLPLLVLELPQDPAAREENGYFVDARLWGFAGQAANALDAQAAPAASARLRNMTDRTNSDPQKDDYYLRLDDEEALLGLPAGSEYLLLGGGKDKSLIRNYIGYTLGAEMTERPLEFQLCEVFFRTQAGDLYQGVYLLARLQPRGDGILFHRSPTKEDISIDTYATQNDPEAGFMSIPFMESTVWDERYSQPIGQLSLAEANLYATDSAAFYNYQQQFDVPSFIAAFLLGELTENYAGMADTYYLYDPDSQTLAAAPLWNFEEAFDNQADEPAVAGQIRYDEMPYYAQLLKSPQFARQLDEQYLQLRKTATSEDSLEALIDEAAAYVAPAVARDWSRWDNYASHTLLPLTEIVADDGTAQPVEPFARQTATYRQEVIRIKYQIRQHSLQLAQLLTDFDFDEQEISKEIVLTTNPAWLMLFLVAFFTVVYIARRYGV